MTEVPDSTTQDNKPPEAVPQVASSRVLVIAVSLAALAVIGATVASLPSFSRSALPVFKQLFASSVDRSASPDFNRFSPPKPNRVAATPQAPVLVPDPVVRAGLRDIQSSEQQNADALQKNADALAQLTQSAAAQQADLKRVTRQLALLTAQVNSLQNPVGPPLTTSSIGGPLTTSSIPRPNPRTRVVHASRKVPPPVLAPVPPATLPVSLPALPKPAGPVSVGGAPLTPAPAAGAAAR